MGKASEVSISHVEGVAEDRAKIDAVEAVIA
jgi:hypothetical protein